MLDLTKRQREIIALLAEGYTCAEAGDILGIAEKTCCNHLLLAAQRNNTNSTDIVYSYVKEQ